MKLGRTIGKRKTMVYIREGIERDGMEREGMEREKEWRENVSMNYHGTCIRDLFQLIFVVKSISDFTWLWKTRESCHTQFSRIRV